MTYDPFHKDLLKSLDQLDPDNQNADESRKAIRTLIEERGTQERLRHDAEKLARGEVRIREHKERELEDALAKLFATGQALINEQLKVLSLQAVDQRTAQYHEEHAAELYGDDIWYSSKNKRWYTKWQAVPVIFTSHGWMTANQAGIK